MPETKIDSLCEVLGEKRKFKAFVDLASGKTPEDAYLRHVWNLSYDMISIMPHASKKNLRSPYFDALQQFHDQLPEPWRGIAKKGRETWPQFSSFYKPFIEAGLLSDNYELTEKGKELYSAIEKLIS